VNIHVVSEITEQNKTKRSATQFAKCKSGKETGYGDQTRKIPRDLEGFGAPPRKPQNPCAHIGIPSISISLRSMASEMLIKTMNTAAYATFEQIYLDRRRKNGGTSPPFRKQTA